MTSSSSKAVLFLQGSTKFGGSKRSLLDTIGVLSGTPYHPIVACAGRGWLTGHLDQLGTPWIEVPFFAWRKWLERLRVAPSIRSHWAPKLVAREIALIHCNEFWWAPHAILLGARLKVPVIVHLRDGHHTLKKARQYRLSKADAVVAVSSELKERFAADNRLHDKTEVIYNGHDERQVQYCGDRNSAREVFGLKNELVVGNVGRLCERKNQQLLLHAMAPLKKLHKLTSFKILFAGDADPEYQQQMQHLVRALSLESETVFLGSVERMDLFYAATDLIVHCARREGLPRVIPEAMLARRAVVATAAEGVKDALPNEDFGAVVPLEDEQQLANQIERMLNDPPRREKVAEQAFLRASSLFSLAAHRDRLLRLYERLTNPKCDADH